MLIIKGFKIPDDEAGKKKKRILDTVPLLRQTAVSSWRKYKNKKFIVSMQGLKLQTAFLN